MLGWCPVNVGLMLAACLDRSSCSPMWEWYAGKCIPRLAEAAVAMLCGRMLCVDARCGVYKAVSWMRQTDSATCMLGPRVCAV